MRELVRRGCLELNLLDPNLLPGDIYHATRRRPGRRPPTRRRRDHHPARCTLCATATTTKHLPVVRGARRSLAPGDAVVLASSSRAQAGCGDGETLAPVEQESGGLSPAGRRSSRRRVSSGCVATQEEVQRILARSAGLGRCALRCVAWLGRGIGARHPASSSRSGAGEQGALAPCLSECPRCGELFSVGTSTRRVSRRLAARSPRAPASSGSEA
jgi:hypothetical protein